MIFLDVSGMVFADREAGEMAETPGIVVLLIEDSEDDAALISRILLKITSVSVDIKHADSLSSAIQLLVSEQFDVILSDLGLPDSQGIETFERIHAWRPNTPVIILSGLSDEDLALKAVQSGAQDYLVKGKVDSNLLGRSLRYAIERQKLLSQLEESLKEIKTLKGLIPMCAWCKKIRDDKGYWKRVETYIEEHTGAAFTHGICPDCLKKIEPKAPK